MPSGIEENKAFVERFIKAFNDDPSVAVEEFLDPDGTWWVVGNLPVSGAHSKAGMVEMLKPLLGAFRTGPTVTLKAMTAEGDRVAVEAESHGELADGRIYHNAYHFLFVVRDGRLHEVKEYADTHHVHELFFLSQ